MSALQVSVCSRCGRAAFPAPALCARCGASEWRDEAAGEGVVEETTVLRRAPAHTPEPVRIGTVRLDREIRLIARLSPGVGAGERVTLELDEGAPVARPVR